ncbi:MAG: NAD(P)/FAD-dependent oxidoreductase [Saprospiraceae bacterium]|nr:NAD(P)/FAD-dependent oxidoreductase [Saprospiraceae bacterium]
MPINLPESDAPRIVVIGAGFGGMTLVRKLSRSPYQVVLIDRNNYHQFQPLFYQVAMSGLEPSSISFPLRKMFHKRKNVFIRMADVESVDLDARKIHTNLGYVNYDLLVFAMGVRTNFFGNQRIAQHALTLKSVAEALYLRNAVLSDLESALTIRDFDERQTRMDIVIVGGGPTGVELAGALAEMKKFIIPAEYAELDPDEIDIYLIQGADRLLQGMSEAASLKARAFLEGLGVTVRTGIYVQDSDGRSVSLSDGSTIPCRKVIWAAGVTGHQIQGIPEECYGQGHRLLVDSFHRLKGYEHVFVIGDQALMCTEEWPEGHPQVAQPAIQQARNLAANLKRLRRGQTLRPFKYKDLGTLATIGRNKAVADLPGFRFQGFFAWVLWLVVHLKSILGVKNKLFVLLNWIWGYVTYDQSLRIIIRHKVRAEEV